MARIPILGGSYQQASVIAGAQRCINLYPEKNAESAQAPVPVTHYSRPGLTPLGAPPAPGLGRGLYVSTLGDLYAVVGQSIYYIDPNWNFFLLGNLLIPKITPVYIADNSTQAVVVDGSTFASVITLVAGQKGSIAPLADPNFLGSDRVDFLDYYLIFNEPNTPNWYSSQVTSASFNALFFGTKTAWPDNVISVVAVERQAWVFGKYKSEVWLNAGTIPFPFQILSGNIIEYGCAAKYSIAKQDVNIYWLAQSPEGARMLMKGAGIAAIRISTNAIEEEWLTYPRIDDAIGQTYQIRGHNFYLIHFPTADRTWCWDESTQEWHEEAFYDVNGVHHRTKDTFMAYAYGSNVSLDWNTGQLYLRDETNYSDNGAPIVYFKGMPHLVDGENFDRITLWRIEADMECGVGTGVWVPTEEGPWSLGFSSGFGPSGPGVLVEPPGVTLALSHDRGRTFRNHSIQPLGSQGQYNNKPTWNRCGYGYDIVVRLSWEGPMHSALQGVFAVIERHDGDE
jgi:hypothetical protein